MMRIEDKVAIKWRRTWIGKYRRAAESALENADGCEHEARAYLNERHLWRAVRLQRILFNYLLGTISIRGLIKSSDWVVSDLEVAEPYF
jgi:hypothetical protein